MTDQCIHCTMRGKLNECQQTECGIHESWYAQTLLADNATLRAALQAHGEEAAKLVANRAAIDELVALLISARGQVAEMCFILHIPMPEASMERYDAAITKHSTTTTTKEEQK